jgi:hypothetical protein
MLGSQGVNALFVELHACSCELAYWAGVVEGSSQPLDLDFVVVSLKGGASQTSFMKVFVGYRLGYVRGEAIGLFVCPGH